MLLGVTQVASPISAGMFAGVRNVVSLYIPSFNKGEKHNPACLPLNLLLAFAAVLRASRISDLLEDRSRKVQLILHVQKRKPQKREFR